jgi:hypothetical protein
MSLDSEEHALAAHACAAVLLFRDAEGNWSARAQARGVTEHVAAHPELSTVLERAEAFIARQLEPIEHAEPV